VGAGGPTAPRARRYGGDATGAVQVPKGQKAEPNANCTCPPLWAIGRVCEAKAPKPCAKKKSLWRENLGLRCHSLEFCPSRVDAAGADAQRSPIFLR